MTAAEDILTANNSGGNRQRLDRQRPNPVLRFFPSLTDVAFLMPLAFLFLKMDGAPRMLEGDTGWHIRAGEWMLANGRVADHDFFSFTKPGERWFAWEWLWDVAFAWLHSHWGMAAVVMASMAVICLTFALLFRLVVRKSRNSVVAIAVTLLAMAASTLHWWARPHVFTLLFVVVFSHILERKRDGEKTHFWLLPLLMVVWTNLHGGFVAGLILIGSYAAGELVAAALDSDPASRKAALRRSIPYMLVGAACFAATFINPFTYHLHLHLAKYLGDPHSPFFRWVSEWQSVSFHYVEGKYFEILILLAIGAGVWAICRRQFVYPILTLAWLHLALVSGRHIPVFAIVSAPVIGMAIVEVLALLKKADVAKWARHAFGIIDNLHEEVAAFENHPRTHLVSVLGLGLIVALLYVPAPGERFYADYARKSYPVEAVNSLGAEKLAGNVFADDEWGDYLIYRLYPSTKVFVDGRFDFYGADFTSNYLDLTAVKGDWEGTLEKYNIKTVLLRKDSALSSVLQESRNWQRDYQDDVAVLFRATSSHVSPTVETSSTAGNSTGREPGRKAADPEFAVKNQSERKSKI